MIKISAVIITYNEEKSISRCIDSAREVADEVVVLDCYSEDATKEICLSKGVRFYENEFLGFAKQKNEVINFASYDYILSLDADEYLSEELIKSILEIKESWTNEAYRMNRLSLYGSRWIRHGNWYPDRKVRLWDRRMGLWGGENPHEKVILKKGVKIHQLKGDILHRAYLNSADTLSKIQNYSEIFARENVNRRSSSVPKIIFRATFSFFKSYVLKRGFLDGFEGLMVAMGVSNHVFYKYAKLYEVNRQSAIGKRLVISRTDNLGDVILSLPLLGFLKSIIPDIEIYFIGKKYTQPIISQCVFVDQFLDREDILKDPDLLARLNPDTIIFIYPDLPLAKIARKLKIRNRVATAHRWYNWLYCNRLVDFSRFHSNLHESQLNFKLLKPFKLNGDIDKNELIPFYGIQPSKKDYSSLISKERFNLIIHPKSKGSAREWSLDSYLKLVNLLPADSFKIFVTGVKEEGEAIRREKPELLDNDNVTDLTGKFNLEELTSFISQVDGLLACSTGVLHLASALGIYALGLYAPMKPIHPGRWMPIGSKAGFLALKKECNDCKLTKDCACIKAITAEEVKKTIDLFSKEKLVSL